MIPASNAVKSLFITLVAILGGCTTTAPFYCEAPMDIGQTITCIAWRAGANSKAKSEARQREEIKRLAKEGEADAQFQLAVETFETDRVSSWSWFCNAAMNGHNNARAATGLFYEYGLDPVQPDSVTALMWYRLAGEEGEEFAEKLEKEIDNKKIIKANQQVQAWKPTSCPN